MKQFGQPLRLWWHHGRIGEALLDQLDPPLELELSDTLEPVHDARGALLLALEAA